MSDTSDLTGDGLRDRLIGALNAERLVNGDGTVRLDVKTARAILAALPNRETVDTESSVVDAGARLDYLLSTVGE